MMNLVNDLLVGAPNFLLALPVYAGFVTALNGLSSTKGLEIITYSHPFSALRGTYQYFKILKPIAQEKTAFYLGEFTLSKLLIIR
jgi:hypothetical protein